MSDVIIIIKFLDKKEIITLCFDAEYAAHVSLPGINRRTEFKCETQLTNEMISNDRFGIRRREKEPNYTVR